MLDWSRILRTLTHNIEHRLDQDIQTTEDTVRYYFFLQLIDAGIIPEQMILERTHPHPEMQQKQIDLSIVQPDGFWDFELKYHRPIPSGRNRPRTQLRGQIISDFYKLALSDSSHRYVLYMTDPKMAAHWENNMPMLVSEDAACALTPLWLDKQPITLKRMVRAGIGFSPTDISIKVQTRAKVTRPALSAWFYEILV